MDARTEALVEQCRRHRECPLVSHMVVPLAFMETIQHALAAQGEEIDALRLERDGLRASLSCALWPDGGHRPADSRDS